MESALRKKEEGVTTLSDLYYALRDRIRGGICAYLPGREQPNMTSTAVQQVAVTTNGHVPAPGPAKLNSTVQSAKSAATQLLEDAKPLLGSNSLNDLKRARRTLLKLDRLKLNPDEREKLVVSWIEVGARANHFGFYALEDQALAKAAALDANTERKHSLVLHLSKPRGSDDLELTEIATRIYTLPNGRIPNTREEPARQNVQTPKQRKFSSRAAQLRALTREMPTGQISIHDLHKFLRENHITLVNGDHAKLIDNETTISTFMHEFSEESRRKVRMKKIRAVLKTLARAIESKVVELNPTSP